MGLERLAAVTQGKLSNFDTDLFAPLIAAAASAAGCTYGADAGADLSLKVISDHLRAGAFLIADGVLPGNEGRAYVLRRILRRAVRHGRLLGLKRVFLHELYPAVRGVFGSVYPELAARENAVVAALKDEEERFGRTLDVGTDMLNALMKQSASRVLDGAEVFKLYDTFGFPLELTREMAAEQGFGVDEGRFQAELTGQRERARAAHAGGGHGDAPVYGALATEHGETRFVGYEATRLDGAKVLALLKNSRPVGALEPGDGGEVLLDATPFYAQSGGQLGDRGTLSWGLPGLAGEAHVADTLKRAGGGLVLHQVLLGGAGVGLKVGQAVLAQVDEAGRAATARHHSATHVLHAALRAVLGGHVQQAGSEVGPNGLRFDFSHPKALTPEERRKVEDWANEQVLFDSPCLIRELTIAEAKAEGAMALFGEKYGDRVRVVTFGPAKDGFADGRLWREALWSSELCGGTHARSSGQLGLIKITGESSVSSGVRRIEAVAGFKALDAWRGEQAFLERLASTLKSSAAELPVRVAKLLEREKELQRKLEKAMRGGDGGLAGGRAAVGPYSLFFGSLEEAELEQLKSLADRKRDELGEDAFVVLASGARVEGQWKAVVVATAAKRAALSLSAGAFIKEFTAGFGGRGGGRNDFAQGGGGDFEGFKEALGGGLERLKDFAQRTGKPT